MRRTAAKGPHHTYYADFHPQRYTLSLKMIRRRRIVRESTISSLSVTVYPTPPDDAEALAAALQGGPPPLPGTTTMITRRMSTDTVV